MIASLPEKSRKITNVGRRNHRLYLGSEAGRFRLEPKSSRMVRVTYTEEDAFSQEEKAGVLDRGVFLDWDYEQNDKDVIFFTRELRIAIDLETAAFSYETADGAELLGEYGWEMEEFTTYRILEEEARVEKVSTADGVKNVVKEAPKVPCGRSFHTRVHLKWSGEEAVYGLGQHEEGFGSLKGQMVYVHQANRKIGIPMLVSTKGYGILTDTYSPMIFSDTPYGSYIYTESDDEIDFYFIFGGSMDGVIEGYRMLTGKASMLPKWAFGYIQSQERYETQQEILDVAAQYRNRGIGLDGIVLDWCSWKDGMWGQKTMDPERFPNPKEMIEKLHGEHVRFMLSIWPNMDEKTDDYKAFKEKGLLLLGSGIYNAFSEKGRELYWQQVKEGLACYGIDAWWCDSSEPVTPEWNHKNRTEPARMYVEYCQAASLQLPPKEMNAYGLYHARTIYEGQRKDSGRRVCNLTRSAYTGQQRYGTILWSGDTEATWDTLKKQVAAGLHFSASGLPYWTVDIGAFFVKRGNIWYWKGDYDLASEDLGYRELFVRWYQWAVFLPVFRGHGTDCRRELWYFADGEIPFYGALLAANRLRYELMPYIYSQAGMCWLEDRSMMRPLAFEYPEDKEVWNLMDQYLFGDAFMVCPVTFPMYYGPCSQKLEEVKKCRRVYLPKGNGWYDYWTGAYYRGGQWIEAGSPISRIPVYVREGSVIPKGEAALSTEEQSKKIRIAVYAGKSGQFTLYEDSGVDYAYENGQYCLTRLSWSEKEGRLTAVKEGAVPDGEEGWKIEGAILFRQDGTDEEIRCHCQ